MRFVLVLLALVMGCDLIESRGARRQRVQEGTCSCDARQCGDDGCGRSCGACGSGTVCTSGVCVPVAPPCSTTYPTGACAAGMTCVTGACCASEKACGSVCCSESAECVADASGNRACAQRCTTSPQCPGVPGQRCCRVVLDASGAPKPYGVCGVVGPEVVGCMCAAGSDCGTGSCTPLLTAQGVPRLPMVCSHPACAPYRRCDGLGSCGEGYCNVCDARGNCYCAQVCVSDAQCGGAACVRYPRNNGGCSDTQMLCAPR